MATYTKILQFTKDLIDGVHDFDAHAFKVALSNVVVNTNATLSAITQITGTGYTAGGSSTTVTTSTASGTAKAVMTDVTWTAGGTWGSLRYPVLYNDTPTSPADPTIAFWDYGSSIALASGETFTWDADPTNGIFTLA